ncbi:hypothetical protein JCM11641_002560 [Rhodosporidiobolus odoratus]
MPGAATLLTLAHAAKAFALGLKARLSRNSRLFLAPGATSIITTVLTLLDKRHSVAKVIAQVSKVYFPTSKVTAEVARMLDAPSRFPARRLKMGDTPRSSLVNAKEATAPTSNGNQPIDNHALRPAWNPSTAAPASSSIRSSPMSSLFASPATSSASSPATLVESVPSASSNKYGSSLSSPSSNTLPRATT